MNKPVFLPFGGMATISPSGDVSLWNEAASFVWQGLEAYSAEELAEFISDEYSVPVEQALVDIQSLSDQWQQISQAPESQPAICAMAFELGSDRLLAFGPKVVSLRASDVFWRRLFLLLGQYQIAAGASTIHIEIKTNAAGIGTMLIDGAMRLENAEPHVLMGGFYQAVVEFLNPAQSWAAFIHAGAVAKNGKAIILAAPSGSGKSTLTALLAAHGFDYLSDDLVPLTFGSHQIAPFPLPISVKPGAVGVLKPYYPNLDPEKTATQYLPNNTNFAGTFRPAVALVFPQFIAGCATHFETLSPAEAMAKLFQDRIHFGYPISPENILDFSQWLTQVPCKSLTYSNFDEAEACLNSLLSA